MRDSKEMRRIQTGWPGRELEMVRTWSNVIKARDGEVGDGWNETIRGTSTCCGGEVSRGWTCQTGGLEEAQRIVCFSYLICHLCTSQRTSNSPFTHATAA